jgi:hypothetical protein
MALIRDELIEAEARAMMRAAIEKSGWYPSLQGTARQRRIEQDVDLHWHLMLPQAREHLEQGNGGEPLDAVAFSLSCVRGNSSRNPAR